MSAPGRFFDRYPQFFETSAVGTRLPDGSASPRLHNRYLGIIEANRSLFDGANVLDLGSHDGRWSLAALDAGARYVTGIEGREENCRKAQATLEALGINPASFNFETDDALASGFVHNVDLILCLGFMYHTAEHWLLFYGFEAHGAKHVILDTKVVSSKSYPCTHYMMEQTLEKPGCARPEPGKDLSVVGVPSEALIYLLAQHFGFEVEKVDWRALISDWRGFVDYRDGSRQTYLLTRRTDA